MVPHSKDVGVLVSVIPLKEGVPLLVIPAKAGIQASRWCHGCPLPRA